MIDRLASRMLRLPTATTGYTRAKVRVPTRDGVELAADLYRPNGEAVGTVLARSPYGRSLPLALPMARIYAARGYNALFVSCRGTFGSGGRFDPMQTEIDDGRDVVAWMRDQPWYTGSFGTVGPSYLGFVQWALLVDPPPDLVAAVISVAPHDFARHVWGTGAFRLDFLGWSDMVVQQGRGMLGMMIGMATAKRRSAPALDALPLAAAASTLLKDRAPWYSDWVSKPDLDDPFWSRMRLGDALDRVQVPVLLISGWHDLFLEQTLEQYRRLRERGIDVAMTVGDWTHLGATTRSGLSTTSIESFEWLEEHVARRGERQRAVPVRVHVSGADEWRDLESWPPPTAARTFYLHPDRSLAETPAAADAPALSFDYDPTDPTPTIGGPLLAPEAVVDDSALASRRDVLAFNSPVLDSDLEVLGAPVVELEHESNNIHVDVFARLSRVDADGSSQNLTEGYLRLDPKRSDEPVIVRMRDTAHRFPAGSRLRLIVAGGSHPQFARNLGTGENPGTGATLRPALHTIGTAGASRLVLPVPA